MRQLWPIVSLRNSWNFPPKIHRIKIAIIYGQFSMSKVGEKIWVLTVSTVSTKQGEKYHNSTINVNFVNCTAYVCWSCCTGLFDILQAMFQMNFFESFFWECISVRKSVTSLDTSIVRAM